jgi:tetratricopeptide (TPR) repeat protein
MRYLTRHSLLLALIIICAWDCSAQKLHPQSSSPASALSSPDEYVNRGTALWHKADYEGAISNYSKAIEIDETSLTPAGEVQVKRLAQTYLNRAILLGEALRNFDGAFADLNRAIQLRPEWDELYLHRSLAYLATNDFDSAIADDTRAIECNPKSARAYLQRSIARYDVGDLNGALDDSNMALETDPREIGAYEMRASLRSRKHDFQGALADYGKSIELCSHCIEAYRHRGELLLYLGKDAEAEQDFKKYLALDPSKRVEIEQMINKYKRLRNPPN